MALDRKTGKVVWECRGAGDRPGYASPVLVEHKGVKQIVTVMSESVVDVRASDGKLMWRFPHKVFADENITTAIFHKGFLIVSGCAQGTTPSSSTLQQQPCGEYCAGTTPCSTTSEQLVLVDGRIQGTRRNSPGPRPGCVSTSRRAGENIVPLHFNLPTVPRRAVSPMPMECLLFYSDDGHLVLAKTTEARFETAGRTDAQDCRKRPNISLHGHYIRQEAVLRYGNGLRRVPRSVCPSPQA